MKNIRIKCPAKINLTLEIVNRREDGFHNIKSVMQLIDLYDFINISISKADKTSILLSGNNTDIPYDSRNLVFKAAELFMRKSNVPPHKISIQIEKNIPVAAGLAGGSTDAAGTIYGLNKLFNDCLDKNIIESLCAGLGSDLNVCLNGGCVLATSRGEVTAPLNAVDRPVVLIKPVRLGISAKYAYEKYAQKKTKPQLNMTDKMIDAIKKDEDLTPFLYNDLEYAVFEDFEELQIIKKLYPEAIMSGSGSTYFLLKDSDIKLDSRYQIIKNLKFIKNGVEIAD